MSRLAAVVVVVALAATACGLPADRQPRSIDASSVPFGLLAPSAHSTGAPFVGPVQSLYFVRGSRLVARKQHVPVGPNVPEQAVRSLLVGPTPQAIRAGDATSIPSQTRLISLDLTGSLALVDLSKEFAAVGGTDQLLAVAQIVLTLTGSPEIRSVLFDIQGRRIEVPDGHGSLSSTPQSASDYKRLIVQDD
jgi:hypothetical protein